MQTSKVFVANNFSKIILCPHGQGGWGIEAVWTFCRQGEGQILASLCGRLWWTAPN